MYLKFTTSSNFAQFGGEKLQNIAVQASAPFPPIFGHAVVTIPDSNQIAVLGGDTFNPDTNIGKLTNEIWRSRVLRWEVVHSLIDRTHYNALVPKIVSQLDWDLISISIPATNYADSICCPQALAADIQGSVSLWDCSFGNENCDNFANRRWSPRRDHQALLVDTRRLPENREVLVLGGRTTPDGIRVEDSFINGAHGGTSAGLYRGLSVLRNDVWMSTQLMDTWFIATIGCEVHTAQFSGKNEHPCVSDEDCWSVQQLGASNTVQCVEHNCVCNMWTPRERFSAAEIPDSGHIYIAGGLTEVSQHVCAEFACGGRNRLFLNDVWRSTDKGRTWEEVARHDEAARWAPRGQHQLVMTSSMLWLIGGRGGNARMYSENTLYADVWVSPLVEDTYGTTWTEAHTHAGFAPRAAHVCAYVAVTDSVICYGGEEFVAPSPSPSPLAPRDEVIAAAAAAPLGLNEPYDDGTASSTTTVLSAEAIAFEALEKIHGDAVRPLDDCWVANGSHPTGPWVQDYSLDTEHFNYIRGSTELAHPVLNYTEEFLGHLHNAGLYTFQDFADSDVATVNALKGSVSEQQVCVEKRRLQKIVYTCSNQDVPYDGEFINSIVIIEGSFVPEDNVVDDGCLGYTVEENVDESMTDLVCRQQPPPRQVAGVGVIGSRYFVVGGRNSISNFGDDVWYRDPVLPITSITTFPDTGSSDTVFEFVADKCRNDDACIYEYRLFDEEVNRELRNWSRHMSPLDYKPWLDGGVYRMEIRAVDAASNRDALLEQGRNAYTWRYRPPLPWLLIILGILLFIALCIGIFVWYRRRKRKIQLERYALKRARRRLKAAKAGDWRTQYNQGKKGGKKKKKKRKAGTKKKKDSKKDGKKKKKKKKSGDKKKKKRKKSAP